MDEAVFKWVLGNEHNTILVDESYPILECSDCWNYWLIKENKDYQVINANCTNNPSKSLFDQEIRDLLAQKCNW